MNLYNYFEKNIQMDKIKDFNGDIYELAIVRYLLKEASSLFYRDYTFFLNKENLVDRFDIYDKKIDLSNIQNFGIVCKSYCYLIKELLKQLYDIDSEMISAFNDRFRHVDLLIKTKKGNKYIIDPLSDLVEMQVGLKTNNFASRKCYESSYLHIIDDICFLNDDELEQIDDKIEYKNGKIYLDDLLENLRNEFEHIEEFLGEKYGDREISNDEKTNLKLKYINRYLKNRTNLNGFVDLVIFSKTVLKIIFSEEELKKMHVYNFFVDEEDLKNTELSSILVSNENRKRGRVINFDGINYIFSLSPEVLEYDNEEWNKIIRENNIFIKKEYPVQLLKYLKENGADRNITHNNEFLRVFNRFETILLNSNKTLEDIKKDNIFIQEDAIITKIGNKNIVYKIENGHLVVNDYGKKIKHIVFYEDEGRKISYKTEPILKDYEKVYSHEFYSNKLIESDEIKE